VPCGLTALALVSPSTPIIARVAMAAVFAATLVDPARGLLAVAVAGPLSAYLAELFGAGDFRLVEAILVSFVAAWLLRPPAGDAGPRLPRYATTAGWLFAVLVLSVTAGVFTQLFRYPDILRATLLGLADSYFSYADSAGVTQAVRTLESLAVVAAAIALFRRRPSLANTLPAACAIAAAGAALASVLLSFGIAPYRLLARQQLLGDLRHAAHVADLNAAGSYFAMILCLSLGMTVRERGRRRLWWMASSAACVVGLWLSRSRSAEAAAALIVAAAALWSTTVAWPRTLRVRVIGGVLGVLVLLVLAAAWRIEKNPTYSELGLRQQFVMSSFRIIGTHPYFGIGPGQIGRAHV